jgi:hypothetical protein
MSDNKLSYDELLLEIKELKKQLTDKKTWRKSLQKQEY